MNSITESFKRYYLDVITKKYTEFKGRASRKEYWMYVLFGILISIALGILDGILGLSTRRGLGLLGSLYSLAVLLPGLGIAVRRLHDTNKSGLWLLLVFVPLIGPIVILVFLLLDSQKQDNQYGPLPKNPETPATPAAPTPTSAPQQ